MYWWQRIVGRWDARMDRPFEENDLRSHNGKSEVLTLTKPTISLEQIQRIAEDHVGTREDCDWGRRAAFLSETRGVEEVC